MIDVERRLQHAARELRGVEIEPPPLGSLGAPRRPTGVARRIPALVMPVLFVLGGLAVVVGGVDHRGDAPDATPVGEAVAPAVDDATGDVEPDAGVTRALTAREEIALISSLGPVSTGRTASEPSAANDVRTLAPRYR